MPKNIPSQAPYLLTKSEMHSDLQNQMQHLLAKELELNGISFDQYAWLSTAGPISEIAQLMTPEAHEGIIPSLGVIFAENPAELVGVERIAIPYRQIHLARKIANGADYFVLYDQDKFFGLVHFREPLHSELQMIRSFPPSGGLIVQRNASGSTKFFQGNSITVHENRIWFTKPHVKEAAWKVSRCVSGINLYVLNRILETAFHLLSPSPRVGATLIWRLTDSTREDTYLRSAGYDLTSFGLSIQDETRSVAICHLMSQVDGATFLDREGRLTRTGVHLKYSDKSRLLIPELKGTRHTSAQRFSYDATDTLVITISSDGPVTVFSDGANVADLRIHSSHKAAHILQTTIPEKKKDISSVAYELVCKRCGKPSMLEQVNVVGWDEPKSVHCPICLAVLHQVECFTIECRPFKRIEKKAA